MSKQYSGLLEGIEKVLNISKNVGKPKEQRYDLIKIWFGNDFSQKLIFKGNKTSLNSLMKDYGPNTVIDLINKEKSNELFSWIVEDIKDIKLKNWDKRHYVASFSEQLYRFLKSIGLRSIGADKDSPEDFKYLILNIFYRLTNYNSGAFVHIRELIDLPTLLKLTNNKPEQRQYVTYQEQVLLEGVLFTLECMDIQLPAPYYKKLGVFEKTDELTQALRKLEEAFESKNTEGKKVNL